MNKYEEAPPGYEWIFRPYIKKKDGTIIRAKKGRMLKILVKIR